MTWISIDVGTSVIKAVAYDEAGHEIGIARENSVILRPHVGWAEQSMSSVWKTVAATVRKVSALLPGSIEAIALTAQGDGCWLVDSEGCPTGNAILWNDARASEIVEHWHTSGTLDESFRTSGSLGYPGLSNAILCWLHRIQPQRLVSAKYALTCNGWIFSQMTGKFVADLSDASNPFGDIRGANYSNALLKLFGSEIDRDLLPPIGHGDDLVGKLNSRAAEELNIAPNIPVVMAPYDIVSTAFGAGVTRPGQACVILGTAICAEAITATLDLTKAPSGTTIALGDGLYMRAMPTLNGCEALEWAANMLNLTDLEQLESLASRAELGSGGVIFLPYLSSAGERAPFLDSRACGSLHGLNFTHTREHIARSVYEGLTFTIDECLRAAGGNLREVRVCGGGARSNLWCQIIADVTGVQVLRSSGAELGARGAFLYALKATGGLTNLEEGCQKYPVTEDEFNPSARATAEYQERINAFQSIRQSMRSQWSNHGANS